MARPSVGGFEARTSPAERRDFFDVRRLIGSKMNWGGSWESGRYDENDVVYDDGWTMICATEGGCTEKPAPYPTGQPFYLYQGLDPTVSDTEVQIIFGNRYTFNQGGYLNGYRVWTVAGNVYSVYTITDPEGAREISELISFTGSGGWEAFGISPLLVFPGTVFELLSIVQEPDPTPTVWSGNWDYTKPQNPGGPGLGEVIHANSLPASIRFNKTDNDGGNRGAELLALTVGDQIQGPSIKWSIQGVADAGTYVDFTVAPTSQDSPTGVFNFEFETATATPITYLKDVGYWATSPFPATQGIYGTSTANIALDTNAYGTDILLQQATVSDQWELVSGGGSGGSGTSAAAASVQVAAVNEFPFQYVKAKDVLDIPNVWTPVASLSLAYVNGGTYMVGTSATWTFDRVTESALLRWRINGSPWNERTQEPKDATDVYTDYYAYPDYYNSGPLVIEIEMMKESTQGTLDVLFMDIFAQRVSG